MADEKTYLIRGGAWMGRVLGDSSVLFTDFSSEQLGLRLPDAVLQAGPVVSALTEAELAADTLTDAAADLETTAAGASETEILLRLIELGAGLARYFVALGTLADRVKAGVTPATVPDAAARADAEDFAETLAKKLSDWVLASTVTEGAPKVAYGLKLLGLLDWTNVPRGTGLTRGHVRRALALHRIQGLISDPVQHFEDTLGWGAAGFDPTDFFHVALDFFDEEDEIEVGVDSGEPFIRGCIHLRRDSSVSPPGLRLTLLGQHEEDLDARKEIDDEWGVGVSSTLRMTGGISARVSPPLTFTFTPSDASAQITGELRGFFDRNADARPFDIVGGTGLLTVLADNLRAGLGLQAAWDSSAGSATIDPLLFAELEGLTLKLGADDADGFIGTLLAAAEIEGTFDLGLEWTGNSGLRVAASGGVEVALPIHKSLGPLELITIYVALQIRSDGTLALELSSALSAQLGPIAASVERIGAALDVRFAEGVDADFGPFDLALRFKPPNGVGLAVDAGVVKGGGYLYLDFEREEYAGALELVFAEWIALRAIGLITTRMPDGSKGFSMLIIITVEFGSGIQLGYGFVLLGVGGLLGVHRAASIEPLALGVRTGAIESVMFPTDIIANAPRIISDLRSFFPVLQEAFLLGPMAKIGWGTPTLISVSLGIVLEIPAINITILGVIKVVLPHQEADILRLQVNFIGRIEPSNQLLWFYAELYDSRVLFITLEGGMGLLVRWGDQPNFVIAVGGFHPRYSPPPLPFPSPPRIAVNILNESYARVRIEAYFAVTSNSVQFGARAELFFGLSEFRIEGHLGFDALFQFDPFYFSFSISASFSVKVFGIGLFSVGFSGLLEGPTPWHVEGKGKISLLFFSISVPFSHTWGGQQDTRLEPITVFPLLEQELGALTNWRAELPSGSNISVSLRQLGETEEDRLVLHPVGSLRISQRRIPLDLELDKVGNQRPSDAERFTLQATVGGGGSTGTIEEPFATGQFVDLGDAGRLSSPGFEPQQSGVEITAQGEQRKTSQAVKRVIRYESIIIDSHFRRFVRPFFEFFQAGFAVLYEFLFGHFLAGSAVAESPLSQQHRQRLQPFDEVIEVKAPGYTVAFNDDNTAVAQDATFSSQARARQFMAEQVAQDPALGPRLHVIPDTELSTAA